MFRVARYIRRPLNGPLVDCLDVAFETFGVNETSIFWMFAFETEIFWMVRFFRRECNVFAFETEIVCTSEFFGMNARSTVWMSFLDIQNIAFCID
jgi:hypothetical protein